MIENINEARIGCLLRCTTTAGDIYEGYLYGYDFTEKWFVLETEPMALEFPVAVLLL
jgi:hypothetical protein